MLLLVVGGSNGQELASNYYDISCPKALSLIRSSVLGAVHKDRRMGASLLRLHFHDCFVNGCDGSVLLDDTANFTGEKTAGPNMNSLRGFEVIDSIKLQMESVCPGVVSCADILTVAARDSVVAWRRAKTHKHILYVVVPPAMHACMGWGLIKFPNWKLRLGRRDSTTASYNAASTDLPSPFMDLPRLISSFSDKGFTVKQMVALSGAHTIGHARCLIFRQRLHGGSSDIDSSFADSLKSTCPPLTGNNDTLSPLDAVSPSLFDNAYFTNVLAKQGLLHSDQQLFSGGSTDAHVTDYGKRPRAFYADFAAAMVKMGGLGTLTGTAGEVRANCRRIN
ncbi:Cationic peroxidase 1 [Linum perenne]